MTRRLRCCDWTPEMDRALLAVKLTSHQERYTGRSELADVAERFGKTVSACRCRLYKLMRARGHTVGTQWTTEGLWTAREDAVVRDHMPKTGERVPLGTWTEIALHLGRTPAAVRVRAYNLRLRDSGRA